MAIRVRNAPETLGTSGGADPGPDDAPLRVIEPRPARSRRRPQWGHDRRTRPLPVVAPPVSDRRVGMARLAIVGTVVAWLWYAVTWLFGDLLSKGQSSPIARTEAIAYLLIVTLLTASTLAYLLSRLGYMYRARTHHRADRAALEDCFDRRTPSLSVLVPSYQEDARVIRNTLLSVALQEYPDVRVVLLIDDPPTPSSTAAGDLLATARALPQELQELLAGPATRFRQALEAFDRAPGTDRVGPRAVARLAAEYDAAASWLENLAASQDVVDHTDAFLANHVIRSLGGGLQSVAAALHQAADERASLPRSQVGRLYRRLAWTFRAEFSSFERKRFVSLSHEPNKAMNLNSYIGLMGGAYRHVETPAGAALVSSDPGEADLVVPDTDYVLTLDADSMLLPEYCLRLVHVLEQHEHDQVAIAQTPYSAFPGSATRLERIAGATTDLQHLVHQGLSYFDATFWVGANALIRKKALDAVAVPSYLGDWAITTYIRDRTVIEDTESTLDLRTHGWKLLNYPERLSYSATPPDFGSLCIQRQRWATGGLLILPKLRLQARAGRLRDQRAHPLELFLRWNYMASVTWSSVSLFVLLAFPFDATLISPLLGLVALPYFWAMASDLRHCGYKRSDVARIYGFNLILLPVNLTGSVATLVQAITASKAAFARTPKVRNRTVTAPLFLFAPYLLIGLAALTGLFAYQHHRWENLGYAALNVTLLTYAAVAFIGLRHSVIDAWIHLIRLLSRPARTDRRRRLIRRGRPVVPALTTDWRSVLGSGGQAGAPLAAASRGGGVLGGGGRSGAMPDPGDFHTMFQPVVELATGSVVGYEALTRFEDGLSPERRLADAEAAGSALALEGMMAATALDAARDLPAGAWLAIKGSARLLLEVRDLRERLAAANRRVLLEVREPSTGEVSPELRALPAVLPPNVCLAVEHAGVGHKSLAVLMQARPAFVKIDRSVVDGLAADRARQVQLATLVRLAGEQDCTVVAPGIETAEERRAVSALGIRVGQGYLLGRPEGAPGAGDESPRAAAPVGAAAAPSGVSPDGPRARRGRSDGQLAAPERRHLSPLRALTALTICGAAAYGTVSLVVPRVEAAYAPLGATWFAPYVDVTATPPYPFQDRSGDPARQVVLGFVVADPSAPCTPSWGAVDTLPQAEASLALSSRIAELEQEGASAIASFGGQAHTDLAVSCTRVRPLTRAYQQVVDRYHLRAIDLDVEGAALADGRADQRRARAVRALQLSAQHHRRTLAVWLTLPVEPSGLQPDALAVLDAMLKARVNVAGVNVMAMDFASPPPAGDSMLSSVEAAISASQRQLGRELTRYGVHLSSGATWHRLGVTVMIGQNDVVGENFTVADGRGLVDFARTTGLGRLSIWSLNRDSQCGTAYAELGVLSTTCSGTAESALGFAHLFAALKGIVPTTRAAAAALPPQPDSNPANAPFPVWSPAAPYQRDYKVVRAGYIYQAKWYNTGQDPAQSFPYAWQTPWELVGPVLPSDHAPALPRLPPGTYPAWSIATLYRAGDRVLDHGLPYQARWFNEGSSPADQPTDPNSSPWQPLFSVPGEPTGP